MLLTKGYELLIKNIKMKKNELTEQDKDFIKENRLDLSMNNIADKIGKPYNRVRDYMRSNNLQLSKEQVIALRVANTNTKGKKKPRKKDRAWDWDALP